MKCQAISRAALLFVARRNAPPGKRVLEYQGPPTFDAVLEWARAVEAWDGSDKLAPGWEVGEQPHATKQKEAKRKDRTEKAEQSSARSAKDET